MNTPRVAFRGGLVASVRRDDGDVSALRVFKSLSYGWERGGAGGKCCMLQHEAVRARFVRENMLHGVDVVKYVY